MCYWASSYCFVGAVQHMQCKFNSRSTLQCGSERHPQAKKMLSGCSRVACWSSLLNWAACKVWELSLDQVLKSAKLCQWSVGAISCTICVFAAIISDLPMLATATVLRLTRPPRTIGSLLLKRDLLLLLGEEGVSCVICLRSSAMLFWRLLV